MAPSAASTTAARSPTATSNKTLLASRVILPIRTTGASQGIPSCDDNQPDPIQEETMKMQIATLALGVAMLAGAAPAHVTPRSQSAVLSDSLDKSVTVQNDRSVPVTVYMKLGPFDRRLGIVPPLKTSTLALPAWAVEGRQRIQLFAHPKGEVDDLATQEFKLEPPARIGMLIPARGQMSSTVTDTMMAVIPPEELADATLTVDNPRAAAVTVFADQGPFDVRLGQVPARSRVTLRFPKSVVLPDESIQLFVHPDRGFDLGSETLHVHRGEHLGLRVPTS
jgi:hypothetical protein